MGAPFRRHSFWILSAVSCPRIQPLSSPVFFFSYPRSFVPEITKYSLSFSRKIPPIRHDAIVFSRCFFPALRCGLLLSPCPSRVLKDSGAPPGKNSPTQNSLMPLPHSPLRFTSLETVLQFFQHSVFLNKFSRLRIPSSRLPPVPPVLFFLLLWSSLHPLSPRIVDFMWVPRQHEQHTLLSLFPFHPFFNESFLTQALYLFDPLGNFHDTPTSPFPQRCKGPPSVFCN